MVTKKRKPMTVKEKKLRKEARDELRAEGILPPCKKPLNRRKFATEVISQYREKATYGFHMKYVPQAIGYMLPFDHERQISAEQVGVLKMLKIALDLERFFEEKKAAGKTTYTVEEMVDVIRPTFNL